MTLSPRDVAAGDWTLRSELPSSRLVTHGPAGFDQYDCLVAVWPADRAWCVARDVDPHWAGIGGASSLITRLVTDARLDVVPADPSEDQPSYL